MRRYVVWFLFLISLSWAQTYDLAIIGGRVLDPANHIDDIRNIGVNNGQIVEVTRKKIKAKEVVNASGFVVVPGFIDILATYPNQDESAIFKVTVPATIITSDCLGEPLGAAPNLSKSYLGIDVCIISTAQQARPKVIQ